MKAVEAEEKQNNFCEPLTPRPMLGPALGLAAGIWAAESLGAEAETFSWPVLLLPSVGLVLVLCSRAGRGWLLTAGLLAAAFGVGFQRHQLAVRRPANHVSHVLSDEPVLTRIAGVIVSTPVTRPGEKRNPFLATDPPPRTRFVLAARYLLTCDPPLPLRGRILVNVEAENLGLRLGDAVELTGKLYRPVGPRNPGEVDWRRWYYLEGIDAGLKVESPGCVRPGILPADWFLRLTRSIRSVAQAMLLEPYVDAGQEDVARLLDTLALGQRSAVDRKINEAFLRAGGLHFLAVSGFNVAVLAGATWWLVRRALRRSATTTALATLIVILLYALVAEPNAPILRATICGVLATLAVLTHRPVCSINWLATAAVCILLFDPLELFRASFQLSFVQVLVLLTVVPALRRTILPLRGDVGVIETGIFANRLSTRRIAARLVWRGFSRATLGLLAVCAVAWAFALPLVAYHFERVAPWGIAGTTLLTVPVTVATWLSFLTTVANLVFPPAAELLGAALGWVTKLILEGVGLFERLPAAVIDCSPPPAWLVGVTYALVLTPLLISGTPRWRTAVSAPTLGPRRAWLSSVVALVLLWAGWWTWPGPRPDGACRVHVLAVGNGSATIITTPEGRAICFDVGTDRNVDAGEVLARALRRLGIRRLEHVFISHANFDHYSGLPSLLARVPVRRLLFNGQMLGQSLQSQLTGHGPGVAPEAVGAGDRLDTGGLRIEVLWPPMQLPAGSWSVNDTSLVLRIGVNGRTVLLPADIESAAMRSLLEEVAAGRIRLAADVLVAPHHGSASGRYATAFYAAVAPELVIVSAADSRPKLQTLVRETLGPAAQLFNTAESGAITVRIGRDGVLTVDCFSEARAPR